MKKGGEYNTKYGAKLKNIKLYAQRGQIQFWPKWTIMWVNGIG